MPILNMIYGGGGQSGPKTGYLEFLIVGGGGSGGGCLGNNYSAGGGGGAGGVIECSCYAINSECNTLLEIKVGTGGNGGNGGCSYIDSLIAYGGGRGGGYFGGWVGGSNGGSGGGGGFNCRGGGCTGGSGCSGQGYNGAIGKRIGSNNNNNVGGGGGGAGGAGCEGTCNGSVIGGMGGAGISSSISGVETCYAVGGQGGTVNTIGQSPAYYGSGGGGWKNGDGGLCRGCQGVVIIRYKTNGSCGIKPDSTGGCKYTCGDYTIHCFTDTSQVQQFVPVFK